MTQSEFPERKRNGANAPKGPLYHHDALNYWELKNRKINKKPFPFLACESRGLTALPVGQNECHIEGVRVSLVEPGLVFSGFQSVAGYPDGMIKTMKDKFGPIPEVDDIADAVYYIVSRPPHVHVCDIVVRPTRQDYP